MELLRRGHEVSTASIPDVELGDWFPSRVGVVHANLFKAPPADLVELVGGHDALVYAIGPDDRVTPPAPAYEFFHHRLVDCCGRVLDAAREAGVRKAVVLNSYFAYFDREWPELRLAERHPYVRCRVEQARRAIEAGWGRMDVCVLELPYIFGAMPGRMPLWRDVLFERVRKMPVVFFPRGGTNAIAVEAVGQAIAGAVERGEHGRRYPVGDENLTWKELLSVVLDAMGLKRRVVTLPTRVATWYGKLLKSREKRHGLESGLDLARFFADVQSRELFFDPEPTCRALGYERGGVVEAIKRAVAACYPDSPAAAELGREGGAAAAAS